MAQEVVLKLRVNDDELDQLKAGLEDLGAEFDIIEGNTKKVDKGFKQIGKSSFVFQELNRMTGGFAGKLVDVYNGIGKMNIGLTATRSALIATGVGAFVVALGLVVAYWDEIVEFITEANAKLETQIRRSNIYQESLSYELEILELQQKIREAEGESTEEIIELRKEKIKLLIDESKRELALLKTQQERVLLKMQEITLAEGFMAFIKGDITGGVAGTESERTALLALQEKIREVNKDILKADLALTELENPKKDKTKKGKPVDLTPEVGKIGGFDKSDNEDAKQAQINKLAKDLELDLVDNKALLQKAASDANEEFLNSELAKQARLNAIEADGANARKLIAKQEADSKIEMMWLVSDGLMAVSAIAGKETVAGKALAVASTLVSTYLAAQQAYASQMTIPSPDAPIRAAVAAGVAVAQGLANVKQILSVKVPGGGGGGSVSGGSPSIPPAFNIIGNNPQNQLNDALLSKRNDPVQAFVVDKEVTSAQEMRRSKINASSIG